MSHKRTLIRNALVSKLIGTAPTYATDAEDRVYPNRTQSLSKSKLPAIKVFDESESASDTALNISRYLRTIETRIEIYVEQNSNLDTALDDIAKQVEDLITADRTISGTASGATYVSTQLEFDDSGDKKVGVATLNFQIKYLS